MKNNYPVLKDIILAVVGGIFLGTVISFFGPGSFLPGWFKAGLLSVLVLFGLVRVWRFAGTGRTLALLMAATFVIRIGTGIFLSSGLPHLGFSTPVQQAGYVFSDAHERDQAAYQIAVSEGDWFQQILDHRAVDQYGGLLAFSALIYQIFSSDLHRPLLIVLFSAFAMSAGVAFLYSAAAKKWGGRLALVAGWVFALYPDGILLGSSQMREPFLLGLTCLLFWISLDWREKTLRTLVGGLIVAAVTCLFSVPAAAALLAVIMGWIFCEWWVLQKNKKNRQTGAIVFVLFLGLVGVAGFVWLKKTVAYEFYLTESASGVIQFLLENVGAQYRIPMITFYGLTQPFLPAALVDASKPIWQGIAIFRALGWYFVLPFILYAFFAVFKAKKEENRAGLIFLSIAFGVWVLISSLRGGGDQWDNPRYRVAFLPWMAILVGWVWQRIRSQKCPWFWRFLAVECVFILFFLNWYIHRQSDINTQMPFQVMIMLIVAISALILLGGVVWDLINRRRNSTLITKK